MSLRVRVNGTEPRHIGRVSKQLSGFRVPKYNNTGVITGIAKGQGVRLVRGLI